MDATLLGIHPQKLLHFIFYTLFLILLLISLTGIVPRFFKLSFELYSAIYFIYVGYISWKQDHLDFL